MLSIPVRWLLDTTILVDLLRGSKSARDWIDSLSENARTISVITAAELLAGCRNRTEQRAIERELNRYETVWVSEDISGSALEYYKRFHLSHSIGFLDCLIAATALKNGLTLSTLNLRHFLPFPDLLVKKPY
jgi:predicted nucleic acid-binding protein